MDVHPDDIVGFDDNGGYYVRCGYCGGAGCFEDDCTCMDDTCCCIIRDPPVCEECGGSGSLHVPGKV